MKQPENLIPKEKMVQILSDLAIMNAARTTNVAILRRNNVETMSYLYSKYSIDSTQFSDSDLYYTSLPEEYEDIYAKVEADLESQKLVIEENKRVNDSLKVRDREKKKAVKGTTDSQP